MLVSFFSVCLDSFLMENEMGITIEAWAKVNNNQNIVYRQAINERRRKTASHTMSDGMIPCNYWRTASLFFQFSIIYFFSLLSRNRCDAFIETSMSSLIKTRSFFFSSHMLTE